MSAPVEAERSSDLTWMPVRIRSGAVMKEWARWFYTSKTWRDTRQAKLRETFGLCEICQKPAEIVHHKIHLTPQNIDDFDVALNVNNLMCVCRECHAIIHEGTRSTAEGVKFDECGNLIEG